jgi:hypothetical protein
MNINKCISNDSLNPFGKAYKSMAEKRRLRLLADIMDIDEKMTKQKFEKRINITQNAHPVLFSQKVKDVIVNYDPDVFSYDLFIHNNDIPDYLEKQSLKFQEEQIRQEQKHSIAA